MTRLLRGLALVGLGVLLGAAAAAARDAIALDVPENMQPMLAVFFYEHEVPTVAAIITCESGWDALAKNPASSASGLGQITRGTWRDLRVRLGADLQPHAIAVWWPHQHFYAMRLLIDERGYQPWDASRGCWA